MNSRKFLKNFALICFLTVLSFLMFTIMTIITQDERAFDYTAEIIEISEDQQTKQKRIEVNKLMGWGFEFSSKRRHWSKQNGNILFDAHITIDKHGRRSVPVSNQNNRDKFLLFIGGSYIFSDSVSDNETYAFHLAQKLENYMPYVYGGWWYAPTQHLRRFKKFPLKEEVEQNEGVAVLLFNTSHARGILGDTCFTVHDTNLNAPKYEISGNGKLEFQGTFKEIDTFRSGLIEALPRTMKASLMNFCWKRMLKDQFGFFGQKNTLKGEEMDLVIASFRALENEIKKSFPKTKFVLLLHYFGYDFLTDVYKRAKSEKFNVFKLDGNALIDHEYPKSFHYSPEGEKLISDQIYKILIDNNLIMKN